MFWSTNGGKTLFVCCALSFANCNKFNRHAPQATFSPTGQTGAKPVPPRLLYPSSHPTVPSHFQYLVHNNPHIPCHTEFGRFSFRAVAEPAPLSLCVLPGPQWLRVLPSKLVSALAEVQPLQYSLATGHFRLGVSCIVPGTVCRSGARNGMQAPMSKLL